jgi:autotransporter-associated beta strand protein
MKAHKLIKHLVTPALALVLGVTLMASKAVAVPYASGVVSNNNTVTFILNQNAQAVEVVRNPGGSTVYPGTTAGQLSFDMTGYTSYQIIVSNNVTKSWQQYVADGPDRNFYTPIGVSIDKNPASPNFGKVFVSNATTATTGAGRNTPEGIYVLRADGTALSFGTGGVTWGGTLGPGKSTIGPDGHLYVADLSMDLCYEMSPDLSSATQLIDASNKTANQYCNSIIVEGTQAAGNRKIYLVDGYYQDASTGLIRYDLGANATATAGDTGTQVIGQSAWSGYYPYDVARDSTGNWYLPIYRATAGQAPVIVKFNGAGDLPLDDDKLWEASNAYTYPYGIDINENAGLVAYAHYNETNVYLFDMATGVFVEKFGTGTGVRGRELAFDAAGNLVVVNSSSEYARFFSPGGKTVAVTKSDGTFALLTGGAVSVAATDPVASEPGTDTGTFTITRTSTAIDVAVYFTLTGTAAAGDYTVNPPSPVTILAGQASTNITITPVNDTGRELPETVVLTLQSDPNYTLGTPTSATLTILDNDEALRYWDSNGILGGAGSSTPTGTWGVSSFWNTIADGTGATGAWGDWNAPVFSAGTDAGGAFTVTVNGTQRTDYLTFEEGTVTLSGGTLILTNWGAIKVAEGLTGTINSVLGGSSGMALDGPGTLVVGGANIYSGDTTISAGTLKLGASQVIPDGSGKGNVSVASTLDLGGFSETVNGLNGAGTVTNTGVTGTTSVLTVGAANASSAFAGQINNDTASGYDKVGLTKIGTGTFTLGGTPHTYSGDVTLSAGTLSIDGNTFYGFGDETGLLKLAGGTLQITSSMTYNFWSPVEMSADTTLTCSGISGTWNMNFGNPAAAVPPIFTGGTLTISNPGASGTLLDVRFRAMGGAVFARPIVLNTRTRLDLWNDNTTTDAIISGPVTGAGQVNYSCYDTGLAKTLVTNANNNYSGGSFLSGSYIGLGADSTGTAGALTAGPIGTGSLTINDDPWLGMFAWGAPRTIGNAIIFNALNEGNALHLDGTNNLTFTGPVSLGVSNRTFSVDAGAMYFDYVGGKTYTFSGVISGGAPGKTLTKTGPGKLVFNGNNTYTSSTVVSEGTLGGNGTIASLVTVQNATIAAGQSAGRLTFQAGLDLNASGTDEWELAANNILTPGTDFDQIVLTGGNLTLGGSSVLNIKFIGAATTPDLGNPFWQYTRQWKVIALSGTAANPGASNFSAITGAEGITAGTFTTTADGTGVTLVYTPSVTPPAPTPVTTMNLTAGPGSDYTLNYAGGTGGQFVLMKTNLLTGPIMSHNGWERVATNIATSSSFTIPVGPGPKAFYYIKSE